MCGCKDCKGITLFKGADGRGITSITDNGDGTLTVLYTDGTIYITPDFTGTQGIQGIQGEPGTNGTDGTNGTNGVDAPVKIVNIGVWDMNTTASVTVAHGLTLLSIRAVDALIYDSDGNFKYRLDYLDGANVQAGAVGAIDATNVTLKRLEGGFFDSVDFQGAGNRGYLTIRYA